MKLSSLPLLLALTLAGCSREQAVAANSASASPAASHPLRGVVTDLLPAQSSLMVKHEDIPGLMPAMTMALKVEPEVLKAAVKGQSLTATIYRRGEEFWLRDVQFAAASTAAAPAPSATPAPAPAAATGPARKPGDPEAGKAVYARVCFACHQPTGLGLPGAFPPLAGAEPVAGDADRLIRIVLHGLQGPIKVKGMTYTSLMPPHGGQLKDQEIADVLTYVRSAWGNQAPPVTVEAVARIRELEKDRKDMWKWDELEKR